MRWYLFNTIGKSNISEDIIVITFSCLLPPV